MDRRTALRRVGVVVLGVNVLLVLAKGAVWYATDSLAVGSEAVNSLADAAYSLAIVGGLYLTTRPPDADHPHGHERIEPFVSLAIALGIFGAGALVLRSAIGSLLSGASAPPSGVLPIAVLSAGGIAKVWLYRYCLRAGRRHNSPALVAAAHDNRADVLTAGAALIGVVGAGAGYPALDPLAAAVVALGILYAAVDIVRDNVSYLVGGAPSEELRDEIVRRALAHPDVAGAHDVVAHYVGPEVDVSLHLEVEGDLTLLEAHDIETAVAASIREIDAVDDVFIHMDPRELGEWKADRDVDRFTGPPDR
ncbi:MAG: cation diffusion facilitator family transporter [Haloferacaceae archaeon]